MKMQRFVTVGAVVALALLVVGCAKPPVEEQNSAKQALDNARTIAEKWAPNEWRSAQQAFDDSNKEIETQNNRFALMRNYDKAKQMLGDAKNAADRAKQAGIDNKEAAKKEAEAKLGEAEAAITAARAALDAAPKTKDTKADLELFKSDLDGLNTSIGDAKNMMGQEAYKEVSAKADTVKNQANDIKAKLDEATAKAAAKKGAHKGGKK
ncbi:MAG: hypothetical protein HY049_17715 [Acidobacteria bacterium]|nr:hypothetical protein [Acidobacteriota bacterium]